MPSRNCTLTVLPGRMGEASTTVLTERDELKPPPSVCAGGVSSVVCCTVQVFAEQAGFGPVIETATGTVPDVIARRSAVPGAGKVVKSTMRKRRRVTGAAVLFVTVRRMVRWPKGARVASELSKSRTRFGANAEPADGSSSETITVSLRWTGEEEFSGAGAPRRAPAPRSAPVVSTKKKSAALSFVSFGKPPVVHGPTVAIEPPLPHGSRTKAYSRLVAVM